ncbi:MAG TPA: FixH family protein [Terriglobia bacterium]|nr:FixH family protein [Terriglobia bacterium]
MQTKVMLLILAATTFLTVGCGSSEPAKQVSAPAQAPAPPAAALKQIQEQRSGDYVIALLNESGSLKMGSNSLTLEFRRGDQLTDPGNVQVKPMMEMKGMGPMLANTTATPSATPGRYNVTTDLAMAGPWKFMVTFSGGQTEFNLATQ